MTGKYWIVMRVEPWSSLTLESGRQLAGPNLDGAAGFVVVFDDEAKAREWANPGEWLLPVELDGGEP